ncbi:MAG: nitrilase [Candidatus Azotimanducaceae bacterium]|jgi:nitrilase
MSIKIAVSQYPPVFLDLDATINRAIAIIEEAAKEGAKLIAFPESFLPGYPAWVWRLRPGKDMALGKQLHHLLQQNSVDISAGGLKAVCNAALEHDMVVVMGMNEIDTTFSGSTVFNSMVIIDSDGTILNRHRKLMPTNPERMVHGFGDGSGLQVVDTAVGRIGGLICWENYMPLSRFALYSQAIDIYIAPTWDGGDTWLATMKHIAKEGGCWVIGIATAIQASDIPDDFPCKESIYPDQGEWINSGDAVVVRPFGEVEAGPLHNEKGILYASIDPSESMAARKTLDVSGHYGRPDIFELNVNRKQMNPVNFAD